MESSSPSRAPFKATKLWNMIIQDFRKGMPLKRHRRGLRGRQHDHCFTSTEAIDWLHDYLRNCDRFGPWVTRAQTVSLLDKFLQSKVIQGVKGSTKTSPVKFEDNADLYRFVPMSPIKKLRSALSSRSNLRGVRTPLKTINKDQASQVLSYDNPSFNILDEDKEGMRQRKASGSGAREGVGRRVPECQLVQKALTLEQREDVWKSVTLNRLQRLLWLTTLDDLFDTPLINPKHIVHNCTHISKNGVVLVPKDEDDLPHWVLSAMKCLANWPNSPDSELPNYPGFERDVFKTVSSYFQGLTQPLLTHHLYSLIVEAFVTAEQRDRGLHPGAESVMTTPLPETIQGLASFQSVENLMLNMTSGGLFGLSPELAGAPGRYTRIGEMADGKGRPLEYARRPTLMDGRWVNNNNVKGITPRQRVDMGHGQRLGIKERTPSSNGTPIPKRGPRAILRSNSMSAASFMRRNTDVGHWQPVISQGRYLQAHPQGMRRCISEPTRGPHVSPPSDPSEKVYEKQQPEPVISRIGLGERSIQESLRQNHQLRHQKPRHWPSSTQIQELTPKFPSASRLHAPNQEQPNILQGSRKFTSQIIIGEDSRPALSTQRPQIRYETGNDSNLTAKDGNSENLNFGFPTQYQDVAANSGRKFGSMNDIGKAAKLDPKSQPTKNNSTRNLFVSKKFGSATELISKLFKKKGGDADVPKSSSSLGHQLQGSMPDLPPRDVKQLPQDVDEATPPNPEALNNGRKNKKQRVSPPYPPPIRATLSFSDIGNSRENNTSNTSDTCPSVSRLRCTSVSDVRTSVEDPNLTGTQGLRRSESSTSLYLSDDKSYTEEALRLCCLLLPPVNRRKLHLLLKLMTRMDGNPDLVLSSCKTTKQLVLDTFSRSILCSQEEIDYDEALSSRIVEYLMDNHSNVLSQPETLKADVEDRLVHLRRGQIKYLSGSQNENDTAPSYCQKVSMAEYESQKLHHSQRAIANLLEVIINDQRMSAKDKKKKLKQFQKTYPEIYARRLPTTASESELFPEKPKIKQPITNIRKSFTKLKSLR